MNLCESTITCVICQCNLNSADASACLRGHIQCQICAIKLNGLCGACTQPCEATMNPQETLEQGPATCSYIATLPQQQSACNSDVINRFFENRNATPVQVPNGMELVKDLQLQNSRDISLSSSMVDVLKRLHQTLCTANCETFEYCIRNILIQVYKDKIEADLGQLFPGQSKTKYTIDIETTSIFELLQTIHVNLCGLQCHSVEYCMAYRFEKLISQYITVTEARPVAAIEGQPLLSIEPPKRDRALVETPKAQAAQNETSMSTSAELPSRPPADSSVLMRATFKPLRNGENVDEIPQPQYELLKHFPEKNQPFQEELPTLNVLVDLEKHTAQCLRCPLHHCKAELKDFEVGSHLLEKHRSCVLESIAAAECKTFFLDPSMLEYNEVDCGACYVIPEVFQTIDNQCKRKKHELPICVMMCRMNLKQSSSESATTGTAQADDDAEIEAEINEALYGVRKNMKKQPIRWLTDDLLVIFPMAPIPSGKAIRTCLTVFLHDKPGLHRSASFYMRSMADSCLPKDLLGSADALWLSSGDVAALTGNGEHAIQCQLMCKF